MHSTAQNRGEKTERQDAHSKWLRQGKQLGRGTLQPGIVGTKTETTALSVTHSRPSPPQCTRTHAPLHKHTRTLPLDVFLQLVRVEEHIKRECVCVCVREVEADTIIGGVPRVPPSPPPPAAHVLS